VFAIDTYAKCLAYVSYCKHGAPDIEAGMDKRVIATTAGSLATGLAMTAAGVVLAVPAIAVGSVGLYLVAGYLWWDAWRKEARRLKPPQTLFEDFERFSPLIKLGQTWPWTMTSPRTGRSASIDVSYYFHFDWVAKSDYASVYLPSMPPNWGTVAATHFADVLLEKRAELQGMVTTSITIPGDREMPTSKSVFSGRVYLYHEDPFTIADLAQIQGAFAGHGFDVHFRGPEYAAVHKLSVPRKVYPSVPASA
jgi:hypothetical protein